MKRQAHYPEAGYSRPAKESHDSLVHSVYGETGELFGTFDFSDVKAPGQIMVELVDAFRKGTGSSGRWRSKSSVREVASLLRRFAVDITKANSGLESLAGFTPEMWWAWRTEIRSRTRWPGQINIARCLLYEYKELSPNTRKALARREKKPKNRLYESYSVQEYRRIYAAAWATVRAARRRIRLNIADLRAFQEGLEPPDAPSLFIRNEEWTRGRLLDHIFRTGRFPGGSVPSSQITKCRAFLRVEAVRRTPLSIFASTAEVFAGIVLLVCERGFNLSVVNELISEPFDADGDTGKATIQSLDKPRRGPHSRYFSSSFTGKAGRIWNAIFEITQPARDHLANHGKPTEKLLVGYALGARSLSNIFKSDWTEGWVIAPAWQRASGLTTDSGEPLCVDFRRLRLTEQVVNRRSNQNSDTVSETVYRRADKQTKDFARTVILQGQVDAISDAQAVAAVQAINSQEFALAQHDPKTLAQKLNVPIVRVKQLLQGKYDTVVTACSDITNSPFAQSGEVCSASFLRCFGCPNAVATPRHLPRLTLLFDAISELASVVSEAVWESDYKVIHEQLSSLLSEFSTAEERSQARLSVTDSDREAIAQLLDRRYDAQ